MARPMAPRGQGRGRVVDAALHLFATHGVSGTSLQMIADHLGVTKAAVYHQFHAKEDIVLAVLEPTFEDMETLVASAEAAPSVDVAAGKALEGLVALMIRHRKVVAALFRDPDVHRVVQSHEGFRALAGRLGDLLLGPEPDTRRRVAITVLGAGLAHAGVEPDLADVEDEVLRAELMHLGQILLQAATAPAGGPA